MDINFNLISLETAKQIEAAILGTPSEERVVIAFSDEAKKTNSGLYIPGNAQEDLPKKGVVVKIGPVDPVDGSFTHKSIKLGDIISYGKYGGKEIYPTFTTEVEGAENLKYYVLSSSEIIFIEPNYNK